MTRLESRVFVFHPTEIVIVADRSRYPGCSSCSSYSLCSGPSLNLFQLRLQARQRPLQPFETVGGCRQVAAATPFLQRESGVQGLLGSEDRDRAFQAMRMLLDTGGVTGVDRFAYLFI